MGGDVSHDVTTSSSDDIISSEYSDGVSENKLRVSSVLTFGATGAGSYMSGGRDGGSDRADEAGVEVGAAESEEVVEGVAGPAERGEVFPLHNILWLQEIWG